MFKTALITFGTIFLGLGVIGIFVPLLPTTPFLLLSAGCYARSSQRLHHWLMNTRYLGHYLKDYKEGKGVPLKVKVFTLSLLLVAITYSIIFVVENLLWRVILFAIGGGVSIHILTIKTKRK